MQFNNEIQYAVPTVWFWPIFNILQLFLQIQRSHNWVNGSKKARKLVVKAVIGSIAQICGGKWVRCKNKPQTSSTRGTCCNISTVFDVITCFFEKPNIEERDAQWECRGAPSSAAPTNEPARALYLHSSNHMRAVCTTEGALGVRGGPRLDYSRGLN